MRVEASRLLAPWPWLASAIQGPLEIRIRSSLGREWRGSGDVILARGKVFGVEVIEGRLPLRFTWTPASGRGQVDLSESSVQLARGRLTGRAQLGLGAGSRREGQVRFSGVDMQPLLRQIADVGQVGNGQAEGQIDFSGSDFHNLAGACPADAVHRSRPSPDHLPQRPLARPAVRRPVPH
jgi:hypothetical protein